MATRLHTWQWLRIGEFARRKRFPVNHFANRMARVFAAHFFCFEVGPVILVRRFVSIFLPVLFLTGSIPVAFSQTLSVQKQGTATAGTASSTDARSLALQRLRQQQRTRAALTRLPVHRQTSKNAANGSGGIIETIAGSAPFQAPSTALQTAFGDIATVVQDASGNLYVSSPQFGSVLKIDSASNVTVYAGAALPAGPAVQSGDGGPAVTARLVSPTGLALDSAGNLYISDAFAETVRKVDSKTGVISNIVGTPGETNGGLPTTDNLLASPQSVALDGQGNLYIADFDSIRKFNLATAVLTTFAGPTSGSVNCDFTATQTCPGTNLGVEMIGPSSISAGPDGLYAAVYQLTDGYPYLTNAIIRIDYQTGVAQLIAGGGQSAIPPVGNTAIGFDFGEATINIAADAAGNLNIASSAGLIYQLPHNGSALTVIAGTGTFGHSGDGGPAKDATLSNVSGISIASGGGLLFSDQYYVRAIDSAGIISTPAGDGTYNFFGDGGPATQAGLGEPNATAIDAKGNLYIADFYNSVIRKVDATTGVITSLTPAPAPTPAGLNYIYGMVADNSNHLYVTSDDGIGVVDLTAGTIALFPTPMGSSGISFEGFLLASGIAFDGNRTLYVVTFFNVLSVDVPTGLVTEIAPFPSRFTTPEDYIGVALDGMGNVYVSDSVSRVFAISIATGTTTTIAGSASDLAPVSGYAGDGGPAVNALLDIPEGLSYDGAGHLLIADTYNHAIRSVDLASGIITTVAGTGTPGFTGDGGNPAAADLYYPTSISFDAAGNLLIADTENDRIRRVVLHPAKLTAALSASSTSFTAGANVTFTATFTGLTLGNLPALGTVTFYDGTTALTDPSATFTSTGNAFTVVLNNSTIAAGTHNITAQFAGDGNYAAVTSPAVTVTVVAPIPPSFSVKAAPASISVAQGASGTAVFTVTSAGGFDQVITFSCGSGLPTGVGCSFTPASVTPTGTAAVTTTLTVTTTGAKIAGLAPLAFPGGRWWIPGGATSLACLLLFGLPSRRRAASKWFALVICGLFVAVAAGCGSGGGSKTNPDATPPGTYTVKVTATASSVSNPI